MEPAPGNGPRLLWGSLTILFAACLQAEAGRGVFPVADFATVNVGVVPDIAGEQRKAVIPMRRIDRRSPVSQSGARRARWLSRRGMQDSEIVER